MLSLGFVDGSFTNQANVVACYSGICWNYRFHGVLFSGKLMIFFLGQMEFH